MSAVQNSASIYVAFGFYIYIEAAIYIQKLHSTYIYVEHHMCMTCMQAFMKADKSRVLCVHSNGDFAEKLTD